MTATLKPGYGYWDLSRYPIGGAFRRSLKINPIKLESIEKMPTPYKGSTHYGLTTDGIKIAFNIDGIRGED